jgi:hypothetical protein
MKIKNLLLIIAILYSGLSDIFDFYYKFNILGLSFFTTVLPWLLLILVIFNNFKNLNQNFYFFLILTFAAHILIVIIRHVFYEELLYNLILGPRYIYFYIVLIMSFKFTNMDQIVFNQYKLLFNLIIIFHFTNSLLKISGYPHLDLSDINSDYYVEDSRFGGLYGAPNVQSNISSIVFLIFVLVNLEMATFKIILFALMTIITILPTISRSGFVITILALLFYFIYNILIKKSTFRFKLIKLLHIGIITILTINIFIFYELDKYTIYLFQRFLTNDSISTDQSRSNRFLFFYDILKNNLNYLFAGIPDKLQSSKYDPLFSISDNSFTLLISKFGIFFSVLYLFILRLSIGKINLNPILLFYLGTVLIVFSTNNSIIWSQWSFYFILGLFLINYKIKSLKKLYN